MGIRRGWKGGFEITRFLSRSLCSGASLTPLPWRGALWRGLGGIDTVTGVERGLERCSFALLASSVGPFDGWLGRLTSSYWVLLSGKPNSKGDRLWWLGAFVALICLWSLKLSLCDRFERCRKEVDCLPMVRPDAGSHLGIRHVYVCLSGVIDRW